MDIRLKGQAEFFFFYSFNPWKVIRSPKIRGSEILKSYLERCLLICHNLVRKVLELN